MKNIVVTIVQILLVLCSLGSVLGLFSLVSFYNQLGQSNLPPVESLLPLVFLGVIYAGFSAWLFFKRKQGAISTGMIVFAIFMILAAPFLYGFAGGASAGGLVQPIP